MHWLPGVEKGWMSAALPTGDEYKCRLWSQASRRPFRAGDSLARAGVQAIGQSFFQLLRRPALVVTALGSAGVRYESTVSLM
jgi:hypothetical protein